MELWRKGLNSVSLGGVMTRFMRSWETWVMAGSGCNGRRKLKDRAIRRAQNVIVGAVGVVAKLPREK
jgi:hypothetical protein